MLNVMRRLVGFRRIRVIDDAELISSTVDGAAHFRATASHEEWVWRPYRWRRGA